MTASAEPSPFPKMGFREFTALIALMMALNAIAIDSMLPALPQIATSLGIANDNDRQLIITIYTLGFGIAQLFYGVLGDRYGRRPVLLTAIACYAVASIAASFAPTFEAMLVARFVQGLAAAATRVLCVAIVRDSYAGPRMARVMSLVFIVFLAAPMFAPFIGQMIIQFAHWRWIFGVLALFGAIMFTWAGLKLPETLKPENKLPIRFGRIAEAFKVTLTTRQSIGYALAMTVGFGGLMGFITSVQQIVFDVFDAGQSFFLVFFLIAAFMGVASMLNSKIVERLGMRKVSHGALMLYLFLTITHAAVALMGFENLITFAMFQAGVMFCFGLMGSNFGALAMEPMGRIAGVAASAQGTVSTIGGALIGYFIGQQFNGSTVPFAVGVSLTGVVILTIILVVERGRLFGAGHPMDVHKPPAA